MKHHEILQHLSFDTTISALDAETSAFGAATALIARRSFDATISALDAEMSALGVAIARSYQRYQRGVSGVIGNCGVAITPQMCNRVTNHGDMSTFSKPGCEVTLVTLWPIRVKFYKKYITY